MDLTISLTEELADFVHAEVAAGRYRSSNEVVRDALRLMARREAGMLDSLRQAWQEGIDSGDAGELDFSTLKTEARARLSTSKA